jgi:ribosomal protein L17
VKNKLSNLNDHLFAQIERLSDETLTPEQIETEATRAAAIVSTADAVIRNAALQVQAARLAHESGADPRPYLPEPRNGAPMLLGKVDAP